MMRTRCDELLVNKTLPYLKPDIVAVKWWEWIIIEVGIASETNGYPVEDPLMTTSTTISVERVSL